MSLYYRSHFVKETRLDDVMKFIGNNNNMVDLEILFRLAFAFDARVEPRSALSSVSLFYKPGLTYRASFFVTMAFLYSYILKIKNEARCCDFNFAFSNHCYCRKREALHELSH